MRVRLLSAVSLALALPVTGLALAGTATAQPAGGGPRKAAAAVPADCVGLPPAPATQTPAKYYCGDSRLGPAALPGTAPLDTLLGGYRRFGGLGAKNFMQLYLTAQTAAGVWRFSDERGFQMVAGQRDMTQYTEPVGAKLDRIGSLSGGYFADPGTPFVQRSMTPDAFNDSDGTGVYHCFVVKKPFPVQRGHVRADFAMPGTGVQEWLDSSIKPKELGALKYKVQTLLDQGYLAAVTSAECEVTPTGS